MADVKIIDIDNEQWNMKDQEARNNILNLQNKDEEITTKINNIEKTTFSNISAKNLNITPNAEWVKVSGLYSGDFYNSNIFIITSRYGEVLQLICPIDDNNKKVEPIAISFWKGVNKIANIRFKNGDVYMLHAGWNALRINQISGDKVEVKMIDENPPEDAIDITINEFQTKQ